MKLSFWIKFAIEEALTLTESLVENSKLTDSQKAALQKFILAGNDLLNAF